MTEASLFNAVSRVMVLAGIKAERDLDEPGYDAKTALEEKMAAAILKHWRAQKKAIKDQLTFWYAGRKAEISAGLIHVEDDPAFLAELINLLLTGMSGGVDLFIEGVSIGFDPTLTNIEAAKWVKKHAKELAEQIDDVTEKGLRRAISDFIETPGMTLRDVMKRLPVNEYRAKMIATTETTRAYAQGQLEAGRRMAKEIEGVRVVKHWYTNNDSIVCELCGPMNGVEVSIDEMFNTPAGEVEAPPLHPNCRCWISTGTRILDSVGNGDNEDKFTEFATKDSADEWGYKQSGINPKVDADSEEALIDYKTGKTYRDINKWLRTGEGEFEWSEEVEQIDRALKKSSLDENVTVYRGLKSSRISQNEIDGMLIDKGYLSTSVSRETGEKYASWAGEHGEQKGLAVIQVPKGTQGIWMEKYWETSGESELLLPRGLNMKIISDVIENDIRVVTLRVMQ